MASQGCVGLGCDFVEPGLGDGPSIRWSKWEDPSMMRSWRGEYDEVLWGGVQYGEAYCEGPNMVS